MNRKQDIYYNLGTGFQNTIFDGSLMMRPVFTSAMDNVVSSPNFRNNDSQLIIFPNPANYSLTIETDLMGVVELFDLRGRHMLSQEISEILTLDTQHLNNGIYLIQFFSQNGMKLVKKIVIQH